VDASPLDCTEVSSQASQSINGNHRDHDNITETMAGESESDPSDSETMEFENPSLAHASQSISNARENQSDSCNCMTCSDVSKSHQPTEVEGSRTVQQEKQVKAYSRKIQTTWYKKYPWITVCSVRHRIFCRLCCSAKQQNLLTRSDRNSKSSLSLVGLQIGRKGYKSFQNMSPMAHIMKQ